MLFLSGIEFCQNENFSTKFLGNIENGLKMIFHSFHYGPRNQRVMLLGPGNMMMFLGGQARRLG